MINRTIFFDDIRATLFHGHLIQDQVDKIEAILTAWEASPYEELADLAYLLATAKHETADFKYMKELGGNNYFHKMYDIEGNRPNKARELGNTHPGDGAKFCGMGFVQSTGRGNARKLTALVKEVFHETVDFEQTPERLMEPKYAALALIVGLERGIFTGKKLGDYLRKEPPDYFNARRCVNALDRAGEIAGYARHFYEALTEASST